LNEMAKLGDLVDHVSGRLTLQSGVPVSTADQSAKTTLYFTPYKGDKIALYDGADWIFKTFSEISLNISGYTASKPYDIWAYDNSGTVALDSTIWTDGTNRATALTTQDGIYVKTGDATRRYIGTIYINSSGGQCDDSITKRYVWNYYNRVQKEMFLYDATSHTYATGSWRSFNNDTSLVLKFVIGVLEDALIAHVSGKITCNTDTEDGRIGVGIDSTSSGYSRFFVNLDINSSINLTAKMGMSQSILSGLTSSGYHYLSILELAATGTCGFEEGDLAATLMM